MCSDPKLLQNLKPLTPPTKVYLPNGSFLVAKQVGKVQLIDQLVLEEVLLLPDFHYNLISINRLAACSSVAVKFDMCGCVIQYRKTNVVLAKGREAGNLYLLNVFCDRSLTSSHTKVLNTCMY